MDQFSVRLECLDDLGNIRLPAIRDSMAAAVAAVDKAVDWITAAFDTEGRSYGDEPFDTSMPGEFYLFWQPGNECYVALDFMRRAFADNCENVDLAARAIREIALRYRQADGRA